MRGQNLVDHVLGKAENADAAAAGHKMVDMKVDAFEACPTLRLKHQQRQLEEHLKMGSSWEGKESCRGHLRNA